MSGIGAFINGIFDGVEDRHRWDDRKTRNERIETQDKRAGERHDWAREDRDRTRRRQDAADARADEVFDWRREDRQRASDDRNSEKEFFEGLTEDEGDAPQDPQGVPTPPRPSSQGVKPPAAEAAPDTQAGQAPQASPPASDPASRQTSPAASLGVVTRRDNAPTDAPSVMKQAPEAAPMPVPGQTPPRGPSAGTDPNVRTPRGVLPEPQAGNTPPAPTGGNREARARALGVDPELVQAAGIADQMEQSLATGTSFKTGQPLTPDEQSRFATTVQRADEALAHFEQTPPDIQDGQTDAPFSRTARTSGRTARQQADQASSAAIRQAQNRRAGAIARKPDRGPGRVPGQNEAPERAPQPAPMTAPAGQSAAPQPAEATREGTPTPSIQTAETTTPRTRSGVTGQAARPTKAQVDRAEQDFMTRFLDKNAPKIIEFYLSRGEIDKAAKFDEFVKSREAQDGMRAWARAAHAAAIGDERGFIEGIEEAYNATGYYDDGYTMVQGKSALLRDDDNNVAGAQITFRDEQTGEEFEQTFNSTEDLYGVGLKLLAPEEVFERGWADVQAAEDFRRGIEQKLVEMQIGGDTRELIMKVAKHLNETSVDFATLGVDEQMRRVRDFIERTRPQTSGGAGATTGVTPPTAQQQPQPPVYR